MLQNRKGRLRRLALVLAVTTTLTVTPLSGVTASAEMPQDDWAFLNSFVPALNRTWDEAPLINKDFTVNAPVMGNGDMSVAIGGNEYEQAYYMRNSDFWSDDDGPGGFQGVNQVPAGVLKIRSESPAVNLALGKTVTWSSEIRAAVAMYDNPAVNAVDGQIGTIWSSQGRKAVDPFYEWIIVDLGEATQIGRYVVTHYGEVYANKDAHNTADFKIQYSDAADPDGTWTDADVVTGNTARVTDKEITPFTARYVRLLVTNPESSGAENIAARIAEFELYAPAEIPPVKTVTASSEYVSGGLFAANALDGDDATFWASESHKNDGSEPQWLAIDYGTQRTFDRWVVKHYGATASNLSGSGVNTGDYALQISETGDPDGEWTTVDAVEGNRADFTDRTVEAFTARYVRLLVTVQAGNGSATEHARIAEFELHGPFEDEEVPGEAVAYRHEEDILTAEIHSTLPFGGHPLNIVSYTSAIENTMVVELSTLSDKAVPVCLELSDQVLNKQNYPAVAGAQGDTLWLKRETSQRSDARFIAKTATATRVLGATDLTVESEGAVAAAYFTVEPGQTVTLVTALKGDNDITGDNINVNNETNLTDVKATVSLANDTALGYLKEAHRQWWKDWYLKSYVRTYEDTLDRYYYRMLYQLGTMTRAGCVNPGLHGPWITADGKGQKYSSYCSNDLGAAMYYISLIESNRADNAKMWIDVAYDYIPYGQQRAKTEFGIDNGGTFYPVHWTPFAGANYEPYHWGQKWLSANIAQIGEYYYKYTLDKEYMAEKIYPQMKASALFFEKFLEKDEDGVYNFNHSATHEIIDNNPVIDELKNASMGLGVIKRLFTDIVAFSEDLGVDADKRELWCDIRDHLHELPTTEYKGKTVYATEEGLGFNSVGPNSGTSNIAQSQFVYPMDVVNRFSDEAEQEIIYNTLDLGLFDGGRWNQGNMVGQEFYTAMLRSGQFDVDRLIDYYTRVMKWNILEGREDGVGDSGYLQFPHFTGTGCSLNSFMNNLCVQSYEQGIMFFPEYPAHREAVFKNLLTLGGFLTSGEFRDGKAQNLTVTSQNGGACKVFAPWADANLKITCEGAKVRPAAVEETAQGVVYTFDTVAGKTYDLAPTQEEDEPLLYGDVDEDGSVTAADALMALQAATGKIDLTDPQTLAADVDGIAGVAASDALLILQYATEKIGTFPAERI
ncbi:MAG: discoidin domain-containing protein [Acutalibacteraceae bacterium]|jgi:alpha-L-fucosidase 2